jgi:hypothetical protein
MLLISQGIGDKLNTQERNNSIYILKIQNVLLSEKKKVYCNCEKIQNVCLESAIV